MKETKGKKVTRKGLLFLGAVVIISLFAVGVLNLVGVLEFDGVFLQPKSDNSSVKESCENLDARWLSRYDECEGWPVTKEWCEDAGGEFFECESACRHDKGDGMCIMSCVKVCKF